MRRAVRSDRVDGRAPAVQKKRRPETMMFWMSFIVSKDEVRWIGMESQFRGSMKTLMRVKIYLETMW